LEAGLSERKIPKICVLGKGTVRRFLKRAEAAGLSWPLPPSLDDAALEKQLFPPRLDPEFHNIPYSFSIHLSYKPSTTPNSWYCTSSSVYSPAHASSASTTLTWQRCRPIDVYRRNGLDLEVSMQLAPNSTRLVSRTVIQAITPETNVNRPAAWIDQARSSAPATNPAIAAPTAYPKSPRTINTKRPCAPYRMCYVADGCK
jgi:hypothetical protein